MIRLRKILLYRSTYYIILVLSLLISFYRLNIKITSNYNVKSNKVVGIISKIKIDGNLLSITLKDKNNEFINTSYYFKTKKEKEKYQNFFELGDKIEVKGKFKEIEKSTTKNIFDYKLYARRKRYFYSVKVESIKYIDSNRNIIYKIKNKIYKYFSNFKNGKYLKLILLGDKTDMKRKIINSFRTNGISHLFAISGMHISFITTYLILLLTKLKIKEEKRYLITTLILLLYLLLIGGSPSVTRAFLFFTLLSINKVFYFHIDTVYVLILTFIIAILINPFMLFDIGFQYSFLISFFLIESSIIINKFKSYFISLLITSIISFTVSIPITLYNFYSINILSILYNLFYIPYVTLILFPASIIVLIMPFLSIFYDILINILESTCLFLNNIDIGILIFGKINICYYLLYVIISFLLIKRRKIVYIIILLALLIFHYFYYDINSEDYITMLDIGQGDSFIFHSKRKTLLIDTGGIPSYIDKKWKYKEKNSLVENITIPYLKSRGIRKLDGVILTHGDYDHLGEALDLIDNFKIDKIYLNEGKKNYLEKKIWKRFKNTETCYQDMSFYLGNFKFYSIGTDLGDENSSSIVLYVYYNDIKMLFTGDANFKSEEYLIKNYNLESVDILKLGHHGSKTSSSEEFLKILKPKIALVSAGRENKFKHPNVETLERLEKLNVKVYSTKENGTITINFSTNNIIKEG